MADYIETGITFSLEEYDRMWKFVSYSCALLSRKELIREKYYGNFDFFRNFRRFANFSGSKNSRATYIEN